MPSSDNSVGGSSRLADGLREMVRNSTPKGKDWCPNCEEYRHFVQLQVVEREEYSARNVVKGCPNCRYSFIDQTEWVFSS